MVARALHLIACLALAAAQLPIFWATFNCSMTGERSTNTCCCSRSEACGGEREVPGEEGSLKGACCSVTHHRLPAPAQSELAGRGDPWRQALDDARLVVCFHAPPVLTALEPWSGPSLRALPSAHGGPPDAGAVPLFLAHRALLI
jgi:hypothetical protein